MPLQRSRSSCTAGARENGIVGFPELWKNTSVVVWTRNVRHGPMYLHTWSPVTGAVRGRLWNMWSMQPCWRKYYAVSLFLVLWRFNITQNKDIWERMSVLNMCRLLNKNPQTMQPGGSLHCTRYSSSLEMLYTHGRVYANMTPFYIRDLRLVCLWGLDPGTNPL